MRDDVIKMILGNLRLPKKPMATSSPRSSARLRRAAPPRAADPVWANRDHDCIQRDEGACRWHLSQSPAPNSRRAFTDYIDIDPLDRRGPVESSQADQVR